MHKSYNCSDSSPQCMMVYICWASSYQSYFIFLQFYFPASHSAQCYFPLLLPKMQYIKYTDIVCCYINSILSVEQNTEK